MKWDMPDQQFRLLHILSHHGGQPLKFYGKHMHVSKPNMTKLVDQLIEQGYASREHSNEDRRVILLNLTEAGKEELDKEYEKLIDRSSLMYEQLSEQERDEFLEHINGIINLMEKIQR